jgi:DNA-binding MarR family transcriptional regulator
MAKDIFRDLLDLADGLHSAAIHLLRQVRVEDRASGIGPAQLSALSVLVFGGSMSLKRLAEIEQVKPPTMVRIVHGLVEQGLARTRSDKEDGRKIDIAATAPGKSLMMRARKRRVQAMARALSAMPEEQREELQAAVAVLKKVRVPPAS